MKYLVPLTILLVACTPEPGSTGKPTAKLLYLSATKEDTSVVTRCVYSMFGTDKIERKQDYCPPVIEVTPEEVEDAKKQAGK